MAEGSRTWSGVVVAFLIAVAAVAAWALYDRGESGASSSGADSAGRVVEAPEGCTTLVVGASSEKARLVSEMAEEFNSANAGGEACQFVQVRSVASGLASSSLSEGWDEQFWGFAQPDVWMPVSSSWTGIVNRARQQADLPRVLPDEFESVAQSPLVLAMPRPMAEALGWPDAEIGWDTILGLAQDPDGWGAVGHPEWGPFTLGKTNPGVSTFGFEATVAAYYAATGLAGDLTVADIDKPEVREFVAGIEQATAHYGPLSSVFLTNLWKADDQGQALRYVSAVPLTEKNVFDYNNGDPDGRPETEPNGKPSVPLVAVYPADGTSVFDHPYLVLQSDTLTAEKSAAAEAFLAFLQAPEQQQAFTAGGFRTFQGQSGPGMTEADGMLADQPTRRISMPAPNVLDAILTSWDQLRKTARVLIVLDASGSMGGEVDGVGRTRLALAQDAAVSALDELNPRDELGVWVFSSDLPQTSQPHYPLVDVGPMETAADRREVRFAIEGLTPGGGTPLYRTTLDAVEHMRETLDPNQINAVVLLSDGQNEHSFDDLDQVLAALDAEDKRQIVRVFPIGFSEDADMAALEEIAQASGGTAYDATDPTTIDRVMINVLSSF